jgi:hypothetical protein
MTHGVGNTKKEQKMLARSIGLEGLKSFVRPMLRGLNYTAATTTTTTTTTTTNCNWAVTRWQ